MTPVLPVSALQEGEMTAREVDGVSVLVCRVNDEFHAVSNRCSHASQLLAEGELSGHVLKCPLHGAMFDIRTGEHLAPPATRPIKVFRVSVEGNQVCVEVTKEDRPQRPRFGPLY